MQKDEHVATVRAIEEYSETPPQRIPPPPDDQPPTTCPQRQTKTSTFKDISFGSNSTLNKYQKNQFSNLHEELQNVFDGSQLGLYNGASGPLKVSINMGPTLPPQNKGRMPQYNRSQLEEFQQVIQNSP